MTVVTYPCATRSFFFGKKKSIDGSFLKALAARTAAPNPLRVTPAATFRPLSTGSGSMIGESGAPSTTPKSTGGRQLDICSIRFANPRYLIHRISTR